MGKITEVLEKNKVEEAVIDENIAKVNGIIKDVDRTFEKALDKIEGVLTKESNVDSAKLNDLLDSLSTRFDDFSTKMQKQLSALYR